MATTLQPIVTVCDMHHIWIARLGANHHKYGDPFSMSCVVIRVDAAAARVEGLSGLSGRGHNVKELLGMRSSLRTLGFKKISWQRIQNKEVTL